MAKKPSDKTVLPGLLLQNPAPVEIDSQGVKNRVQEQTTRIMDIFRRLLPSNYVAQVPGPAYDLNFQAIAERIATFQLSAQEMYADSVYDYTRPEFMYQILGHLVFPDAQTDGYPRLEGDLTFREFLIEMVKLILRGSGADVVQEGIELLTDATVQVFEKAVEARKIEGCAWDWSEQHVFEINVSQDGRTILYFDVGDVDPTADSTEVVLSDWPQNPFTLLDNAKLVIRALKAAHALFEYRHLFKESFENLFEATNTISWSNYYYEDLRRYWYGARAITGTAGETLTDRSLLRDITRDFSSVAPGAWLHILTGPNSSGAFLTDEGYVGHYRVKQVHTFMGGDDSTPRAYTTDGGLSGTATISGVFLTDTSQDWTTAAEGELITILAGPNVGVYRMDQALSPIKIRVSPSIIQIERRMAQSVGGQEYEVMVDRLGVQEPRVVLQEDQSEVFYL